MFLKIGIILLLSIPLYNLAIRFKLPGIIGYMLGGIILGPFVFNILDHHFVESMHSFVEFALAYILFLIGSKIKIENIRGNSKIIISAFMFQFSLTIALTSILLFLFLKDIKLALLTGIIASTIAPASTLAVISELDAEGKVTDILISLLILNDLIVIFLFESFYPIAMGENVIFLNHLYISFLKFLTSIAIGFLSGLFLTYLEARVESSLNLLFTALGVVVVTYGIFKYLNLFTYVGIIFTGIVISNASIKHKKVLKELSFFDSFVYVIFFFLAGANMHLDLLVKMLPLTILYVIARFTGMFFGAFYGSKRKGADDEEARAIGMGIITQAGLAMGFAILLGQEGESGKLIMNLILSSTIIFEIMGIILLKKGLLMVGEVKLFKIIEKASEPILDFHFEEIVREFLKTLGIERKKETQEIKAIDLVQRKFYFVKEDSHLSEIIKTFEEAKCYVLPVIDNEYNLLGIIHLKDLEEIIFDKLTDILIIASDIMKVGFPVVEPEESTKDIISKFRKVDFDALPVCKNKKIMGMILRKDIIRFI